MPKYLHFNHAELKEVLQWAEEQGNHKMIGLYQVAQDWLAVIEPIKMGRPIVDKPEKVKHGK